jgi:hypothetical protein
MAKDISEEFILCAAVKFKHTIISGFRHKDCNDVIRFLNPKITYEELPERENQGFLTSENRFVNRKVAFLIAKSQEQIISLIKDFDECELTSEDLY